MPGLTCLLLLWPGVPAGAADETDEEQPAPEAAAPVPDRRASGETMEGAELTGWILLGSGLAAAAVGAVLGGTALAEKDFAGRAFDSQAQYDDAVESVERKALAADVLFGVAGAAIISAILCFVVFDDDPEREPVTVAPAMRSPAGGLLVVRGSF